jgi:hypothetical protein
VAKHGEAYPDERRECCASSRTQPLRKSNKILEIHLLLHISANAAGAVNGHAQLRLQRENGNREVEKHAHVAPTMHCALQCQDLPVSVHSLFCAAI